MTELMRIAWRTVASIISRVWADVDAHCDRLAGLRRIGIDEISYKQGRKYLMVVVDRDAPTAGVGRAGPHQRDGAGVLRPARPRTVRPDHPGQGGWGRLHRRYRRPCGPGAVRAADPLHVVTSATGNRAARALQCARCALRKNPENLTDNQQIKLAWIAATDPRLHRAYQLKEGLRLIFAMPYPAAVEALDRWISWARRCQIPAFVKLQKSIVKHRARILAAIEHNLSNGPIESTHTKIRLITESRLSSRSTLGASGGLSRLRQDYAA